MESFGLCFLRQEQKVQQQLAKPAGTNNEKDRANSGVQENNDRVAPDARVRQLKDQLIRARVYLSLPATRSTPHFMRDLRQRIKEVQRVLGSASKDSELPRKLVYTK